MKDNTKGGKDMARTSSVVAVVGLGSVGGTLLGVLHAAGHDVVGVDCELDMLARTDRRMKAAEAVAGWDGGSYTLTNEMAAVGQADVVIEALPEDLPLKADALRCLNSVCPEHTVLVSTTVSLSLTRLAIESGRPARTLGLRFLRPPAPGASFESVRTAMSCDDAVAVLEDLVSGLELRPETIGARPGGDATALVYAYLNRALSMVEHGHVGQDTVDTAMRLGCGLPAGPLRFLDEVGLDSFHSALVDLRARTGDDVFRPTPLLNSMIRSGALGRKSGRGFYTYDDLGNLSARPGSCRTTGVPFPVRRVGIVGSGTMARGIAEVTAAAGLPTVLVARSRAKADLALETVEGSLVRAVRRGKITADQKVTALALIEGTDSHSPLGDCDMVIEATAEDLTLKRSVFAMLGSVCKPGALLATTTSSLSVTACAQSSGRSRDVLGLHFFNPVPAMKLVELVRTTATGDDVLATAHAFCERLGKTVVECPDRAGFIVNYLLFPYLADAIRLLDRHDVDVEQTDAAVERGFGYPMGPFALLDGIGLDVCLAILRHLHRQFPGPDYSPPQLLEHMVAQGYLGRKNRRGFRRAPTRPA
ncbi:3-hydroxyacyl-CoA dehydrogenase family protein [Streptosporangium sp. NPDC000563]|uniref:3-hydroxyacyl-CoA dehydrogenase family protein n=1 Tax=Streptosporangium sp. NPDC000563 TaxID=3154366 RepID=UPI00331DE439